MHSHTTCTCLGGLANDLQYHKQENGGEDEHRTIHVNHVDQKNTLDKSPTYDLQDYKNGVF